MAACDVEMIVRDPRPSKRSHPCGKQPARWFEATCACGHIIDGHICESCTVCQFPGCLTCWRGGKGHQCPVEFDYAECLCGCETQVRIATGNQARHRMVAGRPIRYAPGHGRYAQGKETA